MQVKTEARYIDCTKIDLVDYETGDIEVIQKDLQQYFEAKGWTDIDMTLVYLVGHYSPFAIRERIGSLDLASHHHFSKSPIVDMTEEDYDQTMEQLASTAHAFGFSIQDELVSHLYQYKCTSITTDQMDHQRLEDILGTTSYADTEGTRIYIGAYNTEMVKRFIKRDEKRNEQ